MSKTLFLKDSKLFIRLKDGGEYEVSNPEILFIDDKIPEDEQQLFLAHCMLNGIEYPGDVEVIEMCSNNACNDGNCEQGCIALTKLVKLLPKKEKEPFVKALEEAQYVKNLQVSNSAHSFTESSYTTQITTCAGKFVNGLCDRCGKPPFTTGNFETCGRWINPPYIQEIKGTIGPSRGTKPDVIVESSESDYKQFEKFDLNKSDKQTIATDGTEFVESSGPQEKTHPFSWDGRKHSNTPSETQEEPKDIDFVVWYSGMTRDKVINAYKRYLREELTRK